MHKDRIAAGVIDRSRWVVGSKSEDRFTFLGTHIHAILTEKIDKLLEMFQTPEGFIREYHILHFVSATEITLYEIAHTTHVHIG